MTTAAAPMFRNVPRNATVVEFTAGSVAEGVFYAVVTDGEPRTWDHPGVDPEVIDMAWETASGALVRWTILTELLEGNDETTLDECAVEALREAAAERGFCDD